MNTLFDFDVTDSGSESGNGTSSPNSMTQAASSALRLLTLPAATWDNITRWAREDKWRRVYRHVVGETRFTPTWRVALVVVE